MADKRAYDVRVPSRFQYSLYDDSYDENAITKVDDDCDGRLDVEDDWPDYDLNLGQIGGVDVGADGHPNVFHRADRMWESE